MIRLSLRDNRVPVVNARSIDLASAVKCFVSSINGSADILEAAEDQQRQVSRATAVPHGFQWRHFKADSRQCDPDNCTKKEVDQLEKLITDIRQNPNDRRLVLISWNPLHYLNAETTTTTHHRIAQFYVTEGELSCKFYHKPLGSFETDVVFDIISYSLLTHLIAHTCDLKAVELVHTAGVLDESQLKQLDQLMIDYAESAPTFPTVQFVEKFSPSATYLGEYIKVMPSSRELPTPIKATNDDSHGNGHAQQQANTSDEYKYFDLIRTILDKGRFKSDRTGTGTVSYFGPELKFSLADNTMPLLTTKRVFWRGVVEELLWFIKGSTDSLLLRDKGIHIWDGNGSKEFLDKIGLGHREEGDLGPVYGFQWRHIGAKYLDKKTSYQNQGLDQLKHIIDIIMNNQHSTGNKPLVLSAWNPVDIPIMALPPCHCLAEFTIHDDRLSCLMYQRSADVGLGVPFNIASYALLTHIIAYITNLKAHELVYTLGDAHIYKDHIEPIQEQLNRTPGDFPRINFRRTFEHIDDIKYEDIELIGYNPQATIKMKMSV